MLKIFALLSTKISATFLHTTYLKQHCCFLSWKEKETETETIYIKYGWAHFFWLLAEINKKGLSTPPAAIEIY